LKRNNSVKLGQNFLINKGVAKKIVSALFPINNTVLEIGPGKGILTDLLLKKIEEENISVEIILVELDEELADVLKEKKENYRVVNDDILKIKLVDFKKKGFQIIGNVPYYISKEIIDWIIFNENYIDSGVLMFQKEFIEKLLFPKDLKDKNPQSIIFNYLFDTKKVSSVSPGSFFPIPKVSSSVFSFKKKTEKSDIIEFYDFLKICFKKRRKTLINNLSKVYDFDLKNLFNKFGMDLQIRAEEMQTVDFEKIFLNLKNNSF
jgi:16S rRNA (adenine1518-N6/adenine1519-N6)-dimethyltransferase